MSHIVVVNNTQGHLDVKTDVDKYSLPPKSRHTLEGSKLIDAPKGVIVIQTLESDPNVAIEGDNGSNNIVA